MTYIYIDGQYFIRKANFDVPTTVFMIYEALTNNKTLIGKSNIETGKFIYAGDRLTFLTKRQFDPSYKMFLDADKESYFDTSLAVESIMQSLGADVIITHEEESADIIIVEAVKKIFEEDNCEIVIVTGDTRLLHTLSFAHTIDVIFLGELPTSSITISLPTYFLILYHILALAGYQYDGVQKISCYTNKELEALSILFYSYTRNGEEGLKRFKRSFEESVVDKKYKSLELALLNLKRVTLLTNVSGLDTLKGNVDPYFIDKFFKVYAPYYTEEHKEVIDSFFKFFTGRSLYEGNKD